MVALDRDARGLERLATLAERQVRKGKETEETLHPLVLTVPLMFCNVGNDRKPVSLFS